MTKLRVNFFLLLVLITIMGCNKDSFLSTEINGVVKDYYSGTVVQNENLSVIIDFIEPRYEQNFKDTLKLNKDGKFFFSKGIGSQKKEFEGTYFVKIENEKYISPNYTFKAGRNYNFDFYIRPKRILSVIFSNVNERFNKINFSLTDSDSYFGNNGFPAQAIEFNETSRDTVINFSVVADEEYMFQSSGFIYYPNNSRPADVIKLFNRCVYIENIDTTFYNVNY
ncbi:hypothetical protein KEM09_21635 [Carboxylicivirga mesophila]|uniref:DUF3823 domain-containing protein n=1 Tax=Carboxylicivirga mesophila TaxID=1166478 RepID=A0ABS5KG90_9BACT|nr:hypothetical protein [Carboxylicivirga mesophila]MBS2214025.1 hypothetical protein [Carboxylicivirga mesophila]